MLYQINEETQRSLKQYVITIHEGRYEVHLMAVRCGVDWNVIITGGDRHHVGALALGVPAYIEGDRNRPTVSVSSLCVPGHKDDELARLAVCELVQHFSTAVSVSVGIHMDKASGEDISWFCKAALLCCRKLEEQVEMTDCGNE